MPENQFLGAIQRAPSGRAGSCTRKPASTRIRIRLRLTRTPSPHDITLGWDLNNTTLRLQLIHEGNGENPALMDEESLVQHTKVYSFYIGNLVPEGESRLVTLTADVLEKNDEGAYVVKRSTAAVYNSMVQF